MGEKADKGYQIVSFFSSPRPSHLMTKNSNTHNGHQDKYEPFQLFLEHPYHFPFFYKG